MNKIQEMLLNLKSVYEENKKELLRCKDDTKWEDKPLIGITGTSYVTQYSEARLYKADLENFKSLEEYAVYVTLVNLEELTWDEIISNLSFEKDYYKSISTDELLKYYVHCMNNCNEDGLLLEEDRLLLDKKIIKESVILRDELDDYFLACKTKKYYFAFNLFGTS